MTDFFTHKEQATDRHVITTDHPYMVDFGLHVFTTGTLQEWWEGERPNLVQQGFDLRTLLKGNHFFTAWDQKSRTWIKHEHVANFNNSTWKWENHNGGRNYGANDLSDWLSPGTYKSYAHNTAGEAHNPIVDSKAQPNLTQTNLGNLIEMNNWYVNYSTEFPDESDPANWQDEQRAASQFIRGIKASLNNQGVMWSSLIPFDFSSLGIKIQGGGNCIKKEWVTFQLQLFDNKNPKKRKRMAALDLSELNLVGSPIDSLGIEYRTGSRRDGEYDPAATNNNPAAKEGGGLDLTKNELTGKWESGTPQIMAMLETDIPAASNDNNTYPSVTDLQSLENTEILTTTSNAYFNPGTGLAMPILMQNANPLQWSPQYKEPRGCRENNKKTSVPVVNISNVPFESGSIVILSRINGAWVPVGFGEKPGLAPAASVFEGKWQFTYLMTNYNYFFRDPDHDNGVDSNNNPIPDGASVSWAGTYENNFWWDYYYNATSIFDQHISRTGGNLVANLFEVGGSKKGFYQTTSWDFMGSGIGGVRSDTDTLGAVGTYIDGHSIAGTQARFDTNMKPLDKGNTKGTHHAPFWGCVFPGGYITSKVAQYDNTDPVNGYKVKGIDFNNRKAGKFFSNSVTPISPYKFFDPDNDHNNGEGSPGIGMFGGSDRRKLYHLPADIGTNASPHDSTNGRPISDQQRINDHLTLSNNGTGSSHEASEEYFAYKVAIDGVEDPMRYAWMRQTKNNVGTVNDSRFSAFDLAPTDPKIIQFRPLRAETYASFDIKNIAQANAKLGTEERGHFGADAWTFVNDGHAPMSWNVLNRSEGLHGGRGAGFPNVSPPSLDTALNHGIYDTFLPGYFINNIPLPYWNGLAYGGHGAGAYGIIGAVCTVQTAGDITITTEPSLGMAPFFLNVWGSSWTAGDLPTSPQTSIMYTRVFSAWPRDLTVYDPRYFAVHHFNPGVGKGINANAPASGPNSTNWQWYNGRTAQGFDNANPPMRNVPGAGDVIGYPNGWYKVWDVNTTEVDLNWPTVTSRLHGEDNDNGVGIVAGYSSDGYSTKVYSNRVIGQDENGVVYTEKQKMRAREHWEFFGSRTMKRRGKLLPYPHTRHSIGMENDPQTALINQRLSDDISIVILNGGGGYANTDRFTTTYGTGKDLYLIPTVNGSQEITGFTIDNTRHVTHLHDGTDFSTPVKGTRWTKYGNGRDYSPGDFISYDKIFDADANVFKDVSADTKSSLRIVPVQSEGEGLEAYFIRGEIVFSNHVDEKPVLVQGATRLTENPPRANVGAGATAKEALQVLSSAKQNQIGTNGISPDSRYDIFLFFQNEISHTMSDEFLSFNGTPKANEQYVNVSISFA
ncbi:hypothetical protein OAF28_01010 [Akkermansiaceae bacterium]|nr:hypothetical protein [Akkermansiaceae bacterium]